MRGQPQDRSAHARSPGFRGLPIEGADSLKADLVHGANVGVIPRQGGAGFGLEALQGLGILWGSRAGLPPTAGHRNLRAATPPSRAPSDF